jgi:hypothetical protein
MAIQTFLGLLGSSLFISVLTLRIVMLRIKRKEIAYILVFLILVLSFIPLSGDSFNRYARGIFNDFSISSMVLMLVYLIKVSKVVDDRITSHQTSWYLLALLSLFFYPMSLGLGLIDPYSWGFLNNEHGMFTPYLVLLFLLSLIVFALMKQQFLLLLCVLLSTIAYQFGILESRNIWDYLFDPILVIYAMIISFHNLKNSFYPRKY